MNQNLKKRALAYVHNDKLSVIPVAPTKVPLIKWAEFQSRFPTDEEINSWFEKWPDMQLGIVTGKISDLTVVDVEFGGDPTFLPQDTFIVKTGGGGWHYYYKYCEGIQNKARIRELVDIRSEGGYVVAPGSVSLKGEYSVIKRSLPSKFPKELFSDTREVFVQPGASSELQEGYKSVLDYEGYGEGQRNEGMAKYVGRLLTKVHPKEWETIAWQIVQQANTKNTPPLPPYELRSVFNSIKARETRKEGVSRLHEHWKGQKEPSSDPLEESPKFEDDEVKMLYEVAESQKLAQEDIYPLGLKIFDDAILGGVCPGDLITIGGFTGHGKTSLCQDWTLSLLHGEKKPKVLWFSYEVLASHLWKKFQEMGMNKEDIALIPAKHSTGNVGWVEAKIKEAKEKFGAKIIMIDHLGFLLPKTSGVMGKNISQNHSSFLTQIVRDLKTIAIQEEVIMFLPVHLRKSDGTADINDIKDSSGPAQESDLVFLIERIKNKEENAENYFTEKTKITLAKNRKTGQTVIADFFMIGGRFKHDDEKERVNDDFKQIKKDAEEINKQPEQKEIIITPYKEDNGPEETVKSIMEKFDEK